MKFVITGGAGHISRPLAETLLAAGHQVTVIGRSAEKLASLVAKGATPAVGSLKDQAFVTNTFKGADAVYLMIPPTFDIPTTWRAAQNEVADVYIHALEENKTKYAVLLSSIGAHLGDKTGPIDGLYDFEKKLSAVQGLNVKFLRPSYFMYNFLAQIPLIKAANIMGANFGGNGRKIVLTHTDEIARVAAEELLNLNFTGQSVRYIANDERTPEEVAAVLGKAIGKELPWVPFSDEQNLQGLLQAGLPQPIAEGYNTMGASLREGLIEEDYWKNKPELGKIKLEDFAKEFAAAYHAS